MVINPLMTLGNNSTSRGVRTKRILTQVIAFDFCCFSQRALHGVHNPCSHRSVVRWGGHRRCPCVYSLYLAVGYRFQPERRCSHWPQPISDPYFKSQLYVEDPATESRYSFYRMGWVNPESATEIKFPPWVGFEPTTSWSTFQRVPWVYWKVFLVIFDVYQSFRIFKLSALTRFLLK